MEENVKVTENYVKNSTKFDYRTMKYCNLYIIKYKRKSFLIYAIMAAVTLGVAVFSFITSLQAKEANGMGYLFPALFVLFAFYMLYQGLNIEKSLDRQLVAYFANRPVAEQIVEFTDEKLTVSRAVNGEQTEPVDLDWIQVTEIHEIPEYYFFFVGKNTPVIVDKRPEAFLEGTLEELKTIVEEKIAAKPYKKLDINIVKKPITYVHQEIVTASENAEVVESEVSDVVEPTTEETTEDSKSE